MAAAAVFALAVTAKVRDYNSDPRFTLMVSESIIKHGTIMLDDYSKCLWPASHHALHKTGDHIYNYYPLGTPLFSVPFVFIANRFGYDMCYDEAVAQVYIAATLCALIFLIMYATARCYVRMTSGLVIVLASFLGSTLISTMGTALWSHDFMVFFASLILLLIALDETGRRRLNPYAVGILIFAAYLTRPTGAVFVLAVLTYLFLKGRVLFIKAAVTSALLLLVYLGFNIYEFGKPLPPYYTLSLSADTFGTALYGHFLSPARGLLVFSPFLLPVFAGMAVFFRRLKGDRLFLFVLGWFGLHLLVVASFPSWYAGWSYGPRLFTDVMPALVLVSVMVWRSVREAAVKPLILRGAVSIYLLFGLAAIYINTWQGLQNPYIQVWNEVPDVGSNNKCLFDWRYPQFLADKDSIDRKFVEYKCYLDPITGRLQSGK